MSKSRPSLNPENGGLNCPGKIMAGTVLTSEQLGRMKSHRYEVQGRTLLDPVMQRFWCSLVGFIPPRLNSNVITVFGLALNLASSVILMWFSPDALLEVPRWACGLAAATMFLYQICDALDGKQCLRWLAKKDWHLAEVFDHACDSISAVFVTIELAICMRLGDRPDLFLGLMMTAMFMFFTAHWQTYVTGIVRFGTLDVTESELSLCFGYFLTAIRGPQIWKGKVHVIGLEWREFLVILAVIVAAVKFINHAIFIWRRGNKVTVAGTSLVSPALHIGSVFCLTLVTKATTDLYEYQPCIFLVVFGLIGAKMCNKVMVAYMTRSKLVLLDTILLGPLVLLTNHFLHNPLRSHHLLWVVLIFTAADLLRYLVILSRQICDLLHLTCFGSYKMDANENMNGK